jgi:hypothetical protein
VEIGVIVGLGTLPPLSDQVSPPSCPFIGLMQVESPYWLQTSPARSRGFASLPLCS